MRSSEEREVAPDQSVANRHSPLPPICVRRDSITDSMTLTGYEVEEGQALGCTRCCYRALSRGASRLESMRLAKKTVMVTIGRAMSSPCQKERPSSRRMPEISMAIRNGSDRLRFSVYGPSAAVLSSYRDPATATIRIGQKATTPQRPTARSLMPNKAAKTRPVTMRAPQLGFFIWISAPSDVAPDYSE